MLSFEFPSDAPEWKEIHQYYGKIRNKIVHEGGHLSRRKPSDRNLIDYAKKESIVWKWSMDPKEESLALELTRPYCEKAIDNFERFMIQLADAWDRDQKQKLHQGHKVQP